MPETNITQALEPSQKNEPHELASALLHNGTAQIGGMVTSVILVGQSAAQFNQAIAPYAAFLFSCLLAVYQVVLVQKIKGRDSFIIAPIAAMILFALALGGNNSLGPATENTPLKNELELVKKQLELRTKELENAEQLISELRGVLDLPENLSHFQEETPHQSNDGLNESNRTPSIETLLNALIRRVHAQPPSPAQPSELETERQKALDALRAYEARQQKLQQELQKMQVEKQRQEEQEKNQSPTSTPLWQKW